MALPYGTTGSLCSAFAPDRLVGLSVKRPFAITLYGRLPIGLRAPLEASVTLLEATTPVKLPTKRGPLIRELGTRQPRVVFQQRLHKHWRACFKPPTYPTHRLPNYNVKL